MNPILILIRDNVVTVVTDWVYPIVPTTYYLHRDRLRIETYEYDYTDSHGNSFYKYTSDR